MFGPWKKSNGKPRQYIDSRDITLLTKVHLVKATAFPVLTYGFESWIIKTLSKNELMPSNCGIREYSSDSLGLQDKASHS